MTQVDWIIIWKGCIILEKIVEQALLYDFYGELLTDHQKSVYEDYVFNDIGISEIAEEQGISRQGVFDLIKRCDKILIGYEDKLHLLEKFQSIKADVAGLKESLRVIHDKSSLQKDEKTAVGDVLAGLERIIEKL